MEGLQRAENGFGSVYGQGAQHRFLGPMCCDVHKRHSPSRAHIWGGGESGLDPRGVQPPHVALTPSRAPQDLPPSPGFKKKRYQYRRGMAESSETSLRDAQILDGDGTLANEAANKYLTKDHAEAVRILIPTRVPVYKTGNRQSVALQFRCEKILTGRVFRTIRASASRGSANMQT